MVTKVMVALRRGARPEEFDDRARRRLAEVGGTRLQLNVDDADVAAALRFGPGEPIGAFLTVWSNGAASDVVDAVAAIVDDTDLHAYRVTERVRLDPAPMPDGVRSPVLAQVAALRRPASMTHEEYLAYWMGTHTAIAIRTQNTSAYVQNVVEEALTPGAPDIAAIVEEHFPMEAMSDPHEFYGSRGDDAELSRRMTELMNSVAAFGADRDLDLVPTSVYGWDLSPISGDALRRRGGLG